MLYIVNFFTKKNNSKSLYYQGIQDIHPRSAHNLYKDFFLGIKIFI